MNLPAQCRITIPDTGMDESRALVFMPRSAMRFAILGVSPSHAAALLRQLPPSPATAYVAADGGLISNLRVGENIILPATYHSDSSPEKFETKIVAMLSVLGYDRVAAGALIAKLPAELSVFERRLVGFIRAAILEPAVIVYDSLWTDLSARELQQVIGFDPVFRSHCANSVSIYLHGGTSFPLDVAFDQTFVL